jgi:outer membrane protein
MRNYFAVAALAATLAVPAVWARTASAAQADPVPTKIGVLNMEIAITSTQEGKQAASELVAKFAPRQTELQNLQKQIQDIDTRLQNTANTLSDDEKIRLQEQSQSLGRTLQRKQTEARDDYQDAQQDLINNLGRKMMTVLDKYSKDNGYAVIIDTSSQQTPVVYAANAVNVTPDIIKLYDQTFPIKAAATSTPARPQTRKPQQ